MSKLEPICERAFECHDVPQLHFYRRDCHSGSRYWVGYPFLQLGSRSRVQAIGRELKTSNTTGLP